MGEPNTSWLVDEPVETAKLGTNTCVEEQQYKYRARVPFAAQLRNVDGDPIAFQSVGVTFADGSYETVVSDDKGWCRLRDVPEGPYKLEFLSLEEAFTASHAARIKRVLEDPNEENRDELFEVLKLPVATVQAIEEFFDDKYAESFGSSFAVAVETCLKTYSDSYPYAGLALLTRAGVATSEGGKYYGASESTEYGIHASPDVGAVMPKTPVTYSGGPLKMAFTHPDSTESYHWFCFNDPSCVVAHQAESVVLGPDDSAFWDVGKEAGAKTWKYLGNHVICCRYQEFPVDGSKRSPIYVEYHQAVRSEDEILTSALKDLNDLPDPDNALLVLVKYVELLEAAEQMEGSGKLDYYMMKSLRTQRDKMKRQFAECEGKPKFPIRAVHIDKSTSEVISLRVFVSPVAGGVFSDSWVLVDWTNVLDKRLTGVYDGSGNSPAEAIGSAIGKGIIGYVNPNDWDSGNRYPPGKLRVQLGDQTWEFETDGASFWDSLSKLLDYVALGAAVVAGVVTLIAPVPGSRVVSFAIWTSIIASTSAAVINIGQRHTEGFGDFRADAIDALSIAGNLMAGGWKVGARVVGLQKFAGTSLSKGLLVGQFGTDGMQAILVANQFKDQYEQVMAIKDPHERTNKMLELIRSATIAGTLTYISLKSTSTDLKQLNGEKQMKLLGKPETEIDVSKKPAVEGDTSKPLEVTVQDKGVSSDVDVNLSRWRVGKGEVKADEAPKPHESSGMPEEHFNVFRQAAQENGIFILVRNTNPASTKWIRKGYPAKPRSVKTKTEKSGQHAGMVRVQVGADGKLDLSNPKTSPWAGSKKENARNYVVDDWDRSGNLTARNEGGSVLRSKDGQVMTFESSERGLVYEGTSKKQYVGDYDLQDVVFAKGTVYTTREGREIVMDPRKGSLYLVREGGDAVRDINNPWTREVSDDLNRRLHAADSKQLGLSGPPQDRVMHGPDAAFRPPEEDVTVFSPDGQTTLLKTKDELQGWYESMERRMPHMAPHGQLPSAPPPKAQSPDGDPDKPGGGGAFPTPHPSATPSPRPKAPLEDAMSVHKGYDHGHFTVSVIDADSRCSVFVENNGLIVLDHIKRGKGLPSASGPHLFAESLRKLSKHKHEDIRWDVSRPSRISIPNIIQKNEQSNDLLIGLVRKGVEELGGKVTGVRQGVDADKHWAELDIEF